MGKIIRRHKLENTRPGHNKQYTVILEEAGNNYYNVRGEYGPIGGWVKSDLKETGVNRWRADNAFSELVKAKLGGGYETVSFDDPAPIPENKNVGIGTGIYPLEPKSPPLPKEVKAVPFSKGQPTKTFTPAPPSPKIIPLDDKFREI